MVVQWFGSLEKVQQHYISVSENLNFKITFVKDLHQVFFQLVRLLQQVIK